MRCHLPAAHQLRQPPASTQAHGQIGIGYEPLPILSAECHVVSPLFAAQAEPEALAKLVSCLRCLQLLAGKQAVLELGFDASENPRLAVIACARLALVYQYWHCAALYYLQQKGSVTTSGSIGSTASVC